MTWQKRIWLASMSMQVQFLASLSELRICRCYELWCRLQTSLRSGVSVAVAQASSCSSDSTPSLGTSVCRGCGPKRTKKQKAKQRNENPLLHQEMIEYDNSSNNLCHDAGSLLTISWYLTHSPEQCYEAGFCRKRNCSV